MTSDYGRAIQTAQLILEQSNHDRQLKVDKRLRERVTLKMTITLVI